MPEKKFTHDPWSEQPQQTVAEKRAAGIVDQAKHDPWETIDIPEFTPPETKLPDPLEVARAQSKYWEEVSPAIEQQISRQKEAAQRLGIEIPDDFDKAQRDKWFQKGIPALLGGVYTGLTYQTPGSLVYTMGDWVDRFSEDHSTIENYFELKGMTDTGVPVEEITPEYLKDRLEKLKKERSIVTESAYTRAAELGVRPSEIFTPGSIQDPGELSRQISATERILARLDAGETLENIWTDGAEKYAQGFEREGVGIGMKKWGAERMEKGAELMPMTGHLGKDFFAEVGATTATVMPLIIATATAPYAPGFSKALSGGYIAGLGLQVAGSTSMEYDAYMREQGKIPSFEEKMGIAAMDAFANMVVDRMRVERYVAPIWRTGARHTMMRTLKKNPKIAKSIYERYIKDMPGLKKGAREWLKQTPARMIGEGMQEGAAEFAVAMTKHLYMDPDHAPDWNEVAQRTWAGFRGGAYMGLMLGGVRTWAQNKQLDKIRKQHGVVQIGTDKQGEAVEILGRVDDNTLSVLTQSNEFATRPINEVKDIVDIQYDTFQKINRNRPTAGQQVAQYQSQIIAEQAVATAMSFTSKRTNPQTGKIHEIVEQETGEPIGYVLKGNPDGEIGGENVLAIVDAADPKLPPQPYNPKEHPNHIINTIDPGQYRDEVAAFIENKELSKVIDQKRQAEADNEANQAMKPFNPGEIVRYKDKEGVVINADNQQGEVDPATPEIRIRVDNPDGTEDIVTVPRKEYDKVKVGEHAVPETQEADPSIPETRPEGEVAPDTQQIRELGTDKHKDRFAITETETGRRYEGQKTYKSKKATQEILAELNDTYEDINFEAVNVRDKSDPESPNQFKIIGEFKKPVEVSKAPPEVKPPEVKPPEVKKPAVEKPHKVLRQRKKVRPYAKDAELQEAISHEPASFQDEVLQHLMAGGRFNLQDFKDHSGWKHEDMKGLYLWALSRDGEKMDMFVQNSRYSKEDAGAMDQINEIIDIISRYNTLAKVRDALVEGSPEMAESRLEREMQEALPDDIDDFYADESLEGQERAEIEGRATDNIENMFYDYLDDDGNINFEKIRQDLAEDSKIFTIFPYNLSEAELSELQNILDDGERQAKIQESTRSDRDFTRDVSEEAETPSTERDAIRDRRAEIERSPEGERGWQNPVIDYLAEKSQLAEGEVREQLVSTIKDLPTNLFDAVQFIEARQNQATNEAVKQHLGKAWVEMNDYATENIKEALQAERVKREEAKVDSDPTPIRTELTDLQKQQIAEKTEALNKKIEDAKAEVLQAKKQIEDKKRELSDQVTDQKQLFEAAKPPEQRLLDVEMDAGRENLDKIMAPLHADVKSKADALQQLTQQRDKIIQDIVKDAQAQKELELDQEGPFDRSDTEVSIPAKYNKRNTNLQVSEGKFPRGLMVKYGTKKKWDNLASDVFGGEKIHIQGLYRGKYADISLTVNEAKQIVDAFDRTLNDAAQRDVDVLKAQIRQIETDLTLMEPGSDYAQQLRAENDVVAFGSQARAKAAVRVAAREVELQPTLNRHVVAAKFDSKEQAELAMRAAFATGNPRVVKIGNFWRIEKDTPQALTAQQAQLKFPELESQLPPQLKERTVLEDFKEQGYVNFIGRTVKSSQDVADMFSIHRSPYIEKLHLVWLKDNKIIGNSGVTSGRADQVAITANTTKSMAKRAKQMGADEAIIIHNHPSGQHLPSRADIVFTDATATDLDQVGVKLRYHIVINNKKYSLITPRDKNNRIVVEVPRGRYTRIKLDKSNLSDFFTEHDYQHHVPQLYHERVNIGEGEEAGATMVQISNALLKERGYKAAIFYLTNAMEIAGFDAVDANKTPAQIMDQAKQGYEENIANNIIIAHDGSYRARDFGAMTPGYLRIPGYVLDVIDAARGESQMALFDKAKLPVTESWQIYEPETPYRKAPQSVFYSPTERALENVQQNRATPQQWKAMLLKNGAKEVELDWMHWNDFIEGEKSLNRQQIQQWIDRWRIKIKEDIRIDDKRGRFNKDEIIEAIYAKDGDGQWIGEAGVFQKYYATINKKDGLFEALIIKPNGEHSNIKFQTVDDAVNWLNSWIVRETKVMYSQKELVTPGGDNYREWLISTPVRKTPGFPEKLQRIIENDAQYQDLVSKRDYYFKKSNDFDLPQMERRFAAQDFVRFADNAKERLEEIAGPYQIQELGDYMENHFDQPNLALHLRIQDFKANGDSKALHIDELQSQWQQDGRKRGFRRGKEKTEWLPPKEVSGHIVHSSADGEVYIIDYGDGNISLRNKYAEEIYDGRYKTVEEAKAAADREGVSFTGREVPDMPFKQTNQVIALGMRRMLRHAAENGYDRITWTTGQQQAARNNQMFQDIELTYAKEDDGTYFARAVNTKDGETVLIKDNAVKAELQKYFGKDIASKIEKGEGEETTDRGRPVKVLKGDMLKSEGVGMKRFYDEMIPNWVKKNLSKYGAKVEKAEIGAVKESELAEFRKEYNEFLEKLGFAEDIDIARREVDYDTPSQEYMDGNIDKNTMLRWYEYHDKYQDLKYNRGDIEVHSIEITPEIREAVLNLPGVPYYKISQANANNLVNTAYREAANIHGEVYIGNKTQWNADKGAIELAQPYVDWVNNKYSHALEAMDNILVNIDINKDAKTQLVDKKNNLKKQIDEFNQNANRAAEVGPFYAYELTDDIIGQAHEQASEAHHNEIVEAIKPIADQYGDVQVVRTAVDLPARLRPKAMATEGVRGIYDAATDQVYVISQEVLTAAEAKETAMHELIGHKGIRKVLGEKYAEAMDKVFQSMGDKDRLRISEIYQTDVQQTIAAEYISEIAETGQNPGLLSRFVSWMRDAFRDMFGLEYTKNDILYMLHRSQEMMRAEQADGTATMRALNLESEPINTINDVISMQARERDVLYKKIPTKPQYEQKKIMSKARDVQAKSQDTMTAPKLMIREMIKRGGKITDATNFYLHENHLRSKNMVNVNDFDQKILRNVLRQVASLQTAHGLTDRQINRYLKAKASIEREDLFDQQAFAQKDNPEGWTRENAELIVSQFEESVGQDGVNSLWGSIREVNNFIIDRWQNDGFIDKDQADVYRNREFYVPLRGWKKDAASDIFDFQQDEMGGLQHIERAQLRTSEPADPLPYLQALAHTAIVMGNKNRYKQSVLNFVRDNLELGKDMFGLERVVLVKKTDEISGKDVWVETTEQPSPEDFAEGRALIKYDRAHYWRATQQQASEREVNVWEGGRRYVVRFTDPVISRAINRRNVVEPGKAVTALGTYATRRLSQMFTTYNPLFWVHNKVRDFGQGMMYFWIQSGLDPVTFATNQKKAHGSIHRFMRKKLNPDNPVDKMFIEFREQGGLTGYQRYAKDFNDVALKLDKEMKILAGKESFSEKAIRTVWEEGQNLMKYGMAQSEYPTRLAAYMSARDSGKSKLEATQIAKNVTVNFDRKGELSATVGSFIAFVNARMQSAYQKAYLAQHNPKKFFAGVTAWYLMGATLTEIFRNLSPKGEDDEPAMYDSIPDYFKYNFMVIPTGTDKFITIPMPFEWRMWWGAGVATNMMLNNQKSTGEGAFDIFENVFLGYSPIGGSLRPSTDPDAHPLAKIPGVRGVVPTALVPAYDLLVNETFSGSQIYREGFTKEVERHTPAYLKSMPYVNEHLYSFAKALNKFGGGSDLRPATIDPLTGEYKLANSLFNINPSIIEHVGEYYLGGVGRFANQTLKTFTAAWKMAQGDDDVELHIRDIPIYNRFVTTPRRDMEYYRQYWLIGDEMRNRTFYRNQARREGDPEGILRSYYSGPLYRAEMIYNRYKARIDDLGQRISITHDPQKRKELVKQRDSLVKEAVTAIEKTRRDE